MFKNIEIKNKLLLIILLVLVAYVFSFGVRLYWPISMAGNPSMMWNNQLMINTNDGYYFATAIKDYLYDIHRDSLGTTTAMQITPGFVYIAVFLQKILPISFETLILYMPAIIASLVVIPIILTFNLINQPILGFFAALIGSIGWSYYNRTMVGYFDSDMFAVFLMFFIAYSFLRILYKMDVYSILFSAFLVTIYPFFYPQGLSLIYAMFFFLLFYLFIETKIIKSKKIYSKTEVDKNIFYYLIFVLSFAVVFSFPVMLKFVIIGILTFILFKIKTPAKFWIYLSLIGLLLFLFYGNIFNILSSKLFTYINRGVEEEGLHFYKVVQTVREAGRISFEIVANRISGSIIGLVLSLIGYIVLVFKNKAFIIFLPLLAIGLFSYIGGLRFTVYAVPVAALSVVYLFWILGSFFKEKKFQYLFVVISTILMVYPNIKHIQKYMVPVVFNKQEVQVLEKLKAISNINDYTLAWWDYGYPIWYYSNTNTLIDGGKHQNDNFLISEILSTDSQLEASQLARISVEKYAQNKFKNTAVSQVFKKGEIDPIQYLQSLKEDKIDLPKKTRDIFLYLPYKMFDIFPTVKVFSNLDLKTGKKLKETFFYKTSNIRDNGKILNLGSGLFLEKTNAILHIGNNKTQLKRFVSIEYTKNGKLKKEIQSINPNSNISVIFMKSYNTILVLDESMYNSLFIQLFVFENYDKDLFELVINSPYAKVYKLKR